MSLIFDQIVPVAVCYSTEYNFYYSPKNIPERREFRIKVFEEKNQVNFENYSNQFKNFSCSVLSNFMVNQ